MDYKDKYLKYKLKYINLKNKLHGKIKTQRNRNFENEIDIYISIEDNNDLNYSYKEILGLLALKIRKYVKSKSFSVFDTKYIIKKNNIMNKILELFNLVDKKFNGIVVTIRKLNNIPDELDKKLTPEEIKKSIYKNLLIDTVDYFSIKSLPIKYNYIVLTKSNIERKKQCFKEAKTKLYEVCKLEKKKHKCDAEEVALESCINSCVIPYKKSKFIINISDEDKCEAKEKDSI